MNKNFKFKLNGLLKLREAKEEKLKMELGLIQKKINEKKQEIVKMEKDIEEIFAEQEKLQGELIDGQFLQFFPYYIQRRRDGIKNINLEIKSLEEASKFKLNEVIFARGETKVIEKIKDKKLTEFKKYLQKKENEEIEELYQIGKKYED